jgi:hypothetical protein
MKLECVLKKVDFVPMVKVPRFWISPETLKSGSILEVVPDIGHQLLAAYPGAFKVISYEEPAPRRNKRVEEKDLKTLSTEV